MIDALAQLPSPCYLLEEVRLKQNLELIDLVAKESGCRFILALKGFAMGRPFRRAGYLDGCSASSLNEARLGANPLWRSSARLCAGPTEEEFADLLAISDRISFNSLSQWSRFGERTLAANVSSQLRVNPLVNEVATDLYNPCGAQSRLSHSGGGVG